MNKWLTFFIFAGLTICCTENDKDEKNNVMLPDLRENPIVVVYDNDVHCAVEGYAQLAKIRNEAKNQTPYVSTVSCGDFVQGGLVGSVSRGEYIIDIMNRVGYDVATLGNHEFDFGISQLFNLRDKLDATMVCANFRNLQTSKPVFPPYKILRYGETEVAFIGFITTSTATNTSPLTYQDEQGNTLYDFHQTDFYAQAQLYIDAARAEGADYVVVLSHLGDEPNDAHPTSLSLIAQTTGVDVVLDGHSHSIISDTLIQNKAGKHILLSSTGTKFENIGVLTIGIDGRLNTILIPAEETMPEPAIETFVNEIKEKAEAGGNQIIATNHTHLSINDEAGNRIVRNQECPLGNLCADAFCYMLNTDVAFINGGGIRDDLPMGAISYNHLLAVFPFGNSACTATLSGQQLADVLECSVRLLPEENGSFMQVSGLRFEVDTTLPSPVVFDEEGLFSHIADAPRRVRHIYIRNRDNNAFEPLNPEKTYTLASFDYQLKELGSEGIFRYATLKEDNLMLDIEVLSNYIEQMLNGNIGQPYDTIDGRIKLLF